MMAFISILQEDLIMHINTAVMKHIIPLLEKYEGQQATKISLTTIAEEVKLLTNKG